MLTAGGMLGDRYRLVQRIASGGMGDVWRADDTILGRPVAVKVLLPSLVAEPGFVQRFQGEARTMATINHPGVVDVYDFGESDLPGGDRATYLVMEYVEGEALSSTLARVGRLTPARTMALMAQAADALQAAHDKGIIHRDVKPGNLLVRPNGTLVLTDFGIARSAATGNLTMAGSTLGTAAYMSPEQASGATLTPLSDVYSLGVVAYQCLSGRRPFEGENPLGVAMMHIRDVPPPLPGDVPPPVRQFVERAVAKDPAYRWPSAAAMAGAARAVAAGHPVPGLGAAAATAVLGGGTAVLPAGEAYARGAAAVPTPRAAGPVMDPTMAGPAAAPRRRSRAPLAMAVIALVLLLLGGLLLANAAGNGHKGRTAAPPATPSATTAGPTAPALATIQGCEQLRHSTWSRVRPALEQQGFAPQPNWVAGKGKRGEVISMPCQAPPGGTVTVDVSAGKNDNGNGNGDSGAAPPSAPTTPTQQPDASAGSATAAPGGGQTGTQGTGAPVTTQAAGGG